MKPVDIHCVLSRLLTYRHDLLFWFRDFVTASFPFPQVVALRSVDVRVNCEGGEAESLARSKTFSVKRM